MGVHGVFKISEKRDRSRERVEPAGTATASKQSHHCCIGCEPPLTPQDKSPIPGTELDHGSVAGTTRPVPDPEEHGGGTHTVLKATIALHRNHCRL